MRVDRSIGIAILILVLAACGSRLSQENFDKTRDGMSQKEVRDILGEPVNAEGSSFLGISGGEALWKDNKTAITVHFLNDKVVSKRMSSADKKGSAPRDDDEKRPAPEKPPSQSITY
jgi:outer membrane protein assembly factor BamE (lipoprotein component of BamABCDE complex)